jgi:hypothetical protein
MPAGDGIVFTYGDFSLDPRPLFTISKEIIKTPSNTGLASKYSVTLEGHILPTGIDPITENKGGLTRILSSGNLLRDAFGTDFKNLKLQCNSDDPIINSYPKVLSVDIRNASDNYIRRADYTITLEMPSLTGSISESGGVDCDGTIIGDLSASGLISLTDDFTVEFLDEKIGGNLGADGPVLFDETIPSVFSIQRTLSAQGNPLSCGAGSVYTEPWQYARAYIENNLGLQPSMTGLTNLMCVGGMSIANNYRNININKTEGTVNATETFIAFTGIYPATEEFEVSVERSSETSLVTVSVNGTVQGLSTIGYLSVSEDECNPTGVPKFNNALAAWSGNQGVNSVSGALLGRATAAYNVAVNPTAPPDQFYYGAINAKPLSESIGYNISMGTITYSNSYDNRPINCYTGALTENISFTYNQPSDIFASLVVIGRARGPLFQSINTSGTTTRDLSINALIPVVPINPLVENYLESYALPFTGYNDFVKEYETQLAREFDNIFVNSHSESWEPKVGSYTLSKSYTVGYCY